MQIRRRAALLLCAALSSSIACGPEPASAPPGAETVASANKPTRATEKSASTPVAARKERPLPAFGGYTLDGKQLDSSSLIGKRTLLFFFNPEVSEARTVASAIASIAALRDRHNFAVAGVAVGSNGDTARKFASEVGLDFPIIDDSSGRITSQTPALPLTSVPATS